MTSIPFYPLALRLQGKPCVIIGAPDDREANVKEEALREAGADVRRIRDAEALREEDLRGAFLVISTPIDAKLSARLQTLSEQHRFLLCCIDQPAFGNVAMTAIAKAGPVRVAVSTSGTAPRLGKLIKEGLQRAMNARFESFARNMAEQRKKSKRDYADGFEAEVTFTYPEDRDA
jgi:precorrin-2 dehydrogenase / sirohydrochlorin ferrochelatase